MPRITTVPVGQRQQQQQQIGRYMFWMGVRTACFVAAVVVAPSFWMWVPLVLAVVLPYISVLVANAGRESPRATTTGVTAPIRPVLAPSPAAEPGEPVVGRVWEASDAADEDRWTSSDDEAPADGRVA